MSYQPKHQAGYTALLCFLVCLINVFGVQYFGECVTHPFLFYGEEYGLIML